MLYRTFFSLHLLVYFEIYTYKIKKKSLILRQISDVYQSSNKKKKKLERQSINIICKKKSHKRYFLGWCKQFCYYYFVVFNEMSFWNSYRFPGLILVATNSSFVSLALKSTIKSLQAVDKSASCVKSSSPRLQNANEKVKG